MYHHFRARLLRPSIYQKIPINRLLQFIQDAGLRGNCKWVHNTTVLVAVQEQMDANLNS